MLEYLNIYVNDADDCSLYVRLLLNKDADADYKCFTDTCGYRNYGWRKNSTVTR